MTVGEEKRACGNPWGEEEELASIFKHAGEELCFDHHHLPCVCWLSASIRLPRVFWKLPLVAGTPVYGRFWERKAVRNQMGL